MVAGFDQSFGFYFDAAGGLAMLTLGVLVALVRPRRTLNLVLATYAALLGLAVFVYHVALMFGVSEGRVVVPSGWLRNASSAALLVLGIVVDRSMRRDARTQPWRILGVVAAVYLVLRLSDYWAYGALPGGGYLRFEWDWLRFSSQTVAAQFVLLLAAVRAWQEAWRQPVHITALLSLGVAVMPGLETGLAAVPLARLGWWGICLGALQILLYFVAGAVWIGCANRRGRSAVVAGLGCMAFPVLGAMSNLPSSAPLQAFLHQGAYGVIFATAVALLAYAILRHHMFDIDIRVKWTLERGTVALVFLAVFFFVAQVAQNFLSTRFGWGLGGAAAGLMLFAIMPIQRAAERFSDKAMPGVQPKDADYVLRKKRETYRNAYAAAWSDGTLTAKDARLLAEFKVALGLAQEDYATIERDWARAT